jgi:LPS sulfotransferase NodH
MQVMFYTSYLLCATCISGSASFYEVPKKTEVARDAKRYFLRYSVPCYTETLEVTDDADYMRVAIERAATPNGAFGAKVVWTHLDSFDINLPSDFTTTMRYHQRRAGAFLAARIEQFRARIAR